MFSSGPKTASFIDALAWARYKSTSPRRNIIHIWFLFKDHLCFFDLGAQYVHVFSQSDSSLKQLWTFERVCAFTQEAPKSLLRFVSLKEHRLLGKLKGVSILDLILLRSVLLKWLFWSFLHIEMILLSFHHEAVSPL